MAAKKDCLDSDTLPLWICMVGSEAVCGGLIAHIHAVDEYYSYISCSWWGLMAVTATHHMYMGY